MIQTMKIVELNKELIDQIVKLLKLVMKIIVMLKKRKNVVNLKFKFI